MDTYFILDYWHRADYPSDARVHSSLGVDSQFPLAVDSADNAFALWLDRDPWCDYDRYGPRERQGARPLWDPIPDSHPANAPHPNVALLRSSQLGKPHLMDRVGFHYGDMCMRLVSRHGKLARNIELT